MDYFLTFVAIWWSLAIWNVVDDIRREGLDK